MNNEGDFILGEVFRATIPVADLRRLFVSALHANRFSQSTAPLIACQTVGRFATVAVRSAVSLVPNSRLRFPKASSNFESGVFDISEEKRKECPRTPQTVQRRTPAARLADRVSWAIVRLAAMHIGIAGSEVSFLSFQKQRSKLYSTTSFS